MKEVICYTCGKSFLRENKEIKRNAKKNRKTFCSRHCLAVHNNKLRGISPEKYDRSNMVLPKGREKDEFSPFKTYLKIIKNRIKENKRKASSSEELTLQDLKDIWDKQKGICPYTGLEMILPAGHIEYVKAGHTPYKASIDRIDSSIGYQKDNIEFVSMIANVAKNSWDKKTLIEFCIAVAKNNTHNNMTT